MKFKNIVSLALIFFVFSSSFSQEPSVKNAVKEIQNENPDFIDAIKIYEKVIEDGRLEDPELFIKIASAYYFKSDFTTANKWFEKYFAVYNVKPLPIHRYWYGQTLKALSQYKKADSLLAPYFESRGERYTYSSATPKTTENNKERYVMVPFKHNSPSSDYSAFLQKDRFYFITYNDITDKDTKSRFVNKSTSDIYFVDDSKKEIQKPQGELNSVFNEGPLAITRDGKTMYFTRNAFLANRYKKNEKGEERVISLNIYRAELIDGKWQNISSLSINNVNYSVGHPALSPDGKTLYFSSDMPGGKGGTDLYSVSIKSNGSLGDEVNLEELNSIGKEMFPFVDYETGNLYFSSDRSSSLGGLDVYVSKPEVDKTYKEAYNIGEPINSTFDDFGYMINNAKKGYYSSNREGDKKLDEIYNFVEVNPFPFPVMLDVSGYLTDNQTGKPIVGAKVSLYDKDRNLIETVITDGNGLYAFSETNIANADFIKVEKTGFLTTEVSINVDDLENNQGKKDIKLASLVPNLSETISISGTIKDNSSVLQKGLADTKITLYDINGNVIASKTTNKDGSINFDGINRKDIAFIRAEKKGFLTEEIVVNGMNLKGDNLFTDIKLSPQTIENKEGTDIASILKTIYFDSGKSAIREDAKLELNKIVQVLKLYPEVKIEIGSHTDSRSSSGFNQKLSERRAEATFNYLVNMGISANRLTYKGYGEEQLLNECKDGVKCSEEKNQQNRRSTFTISKQ